MSIPKRSSTGFPAAWNRYWFQPISAAGFGMMRVSFGLTALLSMLAQWKDVLRYYGPQGILPHDMLGEIVRSSWRFSLLDGAGESLVWNVYIVLIVALLFATVGIFTRAALAVSVILLFSFHEYGTFLLDGGDTLLRLIGFILVIAPCDRAFTISNARKRLRVAHATGKVQPFIERTMAIWPYRLLLWQMVILYAASAVEKFSGTTWREGSAVAIVLHHPSFSRLPTFFADALTPLSPVLGYFTLISQTAWVLVPIVGILSWCGWKRVDPGSLKRALLMAGVVVHGSILVLMDVGIFSLAVFVAYLGLLLDDDFRAIRSRLNGKKRRRVIILFDGRCGFCSGSMLILNMLDWLHRLQPENYHDPLMRNRHAPTIALSELQKSMHIRLQDGTTRAGFFAFRELCWHIPVLWVLVPLLYVPGVPYTGNIVYGLVAKHRG